MQKNSEQISIEARGPAGFWARLDGVGVKELLVVIIVVSCSLFVWWASEQREIRWSAFHQRTQALLGEQNAQIAQVIKNQGEILKEMHASSQANSEKLDDMTYVLVLPQAKREALNLSMPPSLRAKLLRRSGL